MIAEVICKECDLTIDNASIDIKDRITMGVFVISMYSHYKNTGHTLVKLIFTLEALDYEGDFYHG